MSDFWRLRLPVAKGGVTVTWQKSRCSQYPLNLGHRKRTPVLSDCGFILADTHGHKDPVLGNSAFSGKFVTQCILLIAEHFVCADDLLQTKQKESLLTVTPSHQKLH